jgi:membrane protease YdiL (CAAX protease family)
MTKPRSLPLRPLILGILTILIVLRVVSSLLASWNEPQITSRLQLYQTDLLLNATELTLPAGEVETPPVRNVLVGNDPLETALSQYQEVQDSAESTLQIFRDRQTESNSPTVGDDSLTAPTVPSPESQKLQSVIDEQATLIAKLDLRIGLLQAKQDNVSAARTTWQQMARSPSNSGTLASDTANLSETANVLLGLWSDPPRILPDAEQQIQNNLDGWFRYQSLSRLYTLQERADALAVLQTQQQAIAQKTLVKLAVIGVMPVVGSLAGIGILVFLIVQRFVKGQEAVLAHNAGVAWETPWNWEIIWQVLIVGFFLVGQLIIPLLLGLIGFNFSAFGNRARAFYTLTYYLSMSAMGLLVLYVSIRSYLPLPKDWFRLKLSDRWFAWGLGGYVVALPLMIIVSIVNQQLWQGQGGSNPLLQIVLEEGDPVSLGIFFFTAAVAAPIFEETLFRGFLLSSLTRYLPVWGAIAVSGFIFAVAHLSLSEVLPLSLLGCILGVVYTRSRNLLAPMLLHSLWNGATMLSLFVLGSR